MIPRREITFFFSRPWYNPARCLLLLPALLCIQDLHGLFMNLSICLLCLIALQQPSPSAPQPKPGIHNRDTQQKAAETQEGLAENRPDSVSIRGRDIGKPAEQSKRDPTYDPREDALYRKYLKATIVGVAGGIVGLCILIWQSVLLRKAANAAKESADSLKDTERAWIIGSLENLPSEPGFSNGLEVFWIMPVFRNYGRTPGTILNIKLRLHYLAKGEKLPDEPLYEGDSVRTRTFEGELVLPPKIPVQPISVGTTGGDFWQIRKNGEQLFIYGVVHYRDVAGRPFFSRFCYGYFVQGGFNPLTTGFYVGGPDAYNRAT
jgi:hypothetical protein